MKAADNKHARYRANNLVARRIADRDLKRAARVDVDKRAGLNVANRLWRARNLDRARQLVREAGARWRAKPANRAKKNADARAAYDPQRERNQKLRHNFGITASELARQIDRQGVVCPICQRALLGGRKQHVDHDHGSGVVRGVLCARCNRMLGAVHDDAGALERAASYLREGGIWGKQ